MPQSTSTRNDNWLLSRLDFIWSTYFSDVPQTNPTFIRFGRYSRFRLGSIRLNRKSGKTYITITGMFKNPQIPTAVVDNTIAHELVHYTHGFSSKRERLHKYPHAGGIVNQEMKERGMVKLYDAYRAWVKNYRAKLSRYVR
ncbi:hypothetical protein HYS94_03455 [Candidatus Daviesbacteria bacterium]|nr:hypothetical protein [Candidatus Daviesbacteria bacterium]